jgi:hypothetical protein
MTATLRGVLDHVIGAEGVLSIRFASGEVRLRAIDGTAVRVRDRSQQDIAAMFEIDRAEGSLSLHLEQGRGWFTSKGHTPELDVEVPRRASIVIESASGEIAGEGLAGDQRYRTTSGDLVLRRCAGRIVAEAVSGDIDVVAVAEIDLSARTVSGDVEVRAGTLRGLRASTTSGDLKIAGRFSSDGAFAVDTVSGDGLIAPVGDLTIEMTTVTGDLHSEVEARTEGGRGHRSIVIGSRGPVMTFRSLSGDLQIARPVAIEPTQPAATAEAADAVEAPPARDAEPETAPAASHPAPPPVVPDPDPTQRGTTATHWTAPDAEPVEGQADAAGEAAEAVPPPHGSASAQPSADEARMGILRSLERGEIDVAEAGHRLEALDTANSPRTEGTADA